MAHDPYLVERLTSLMDEKKANYITKRMFGGVCFMVDDKMCYAAILNGLMVRVDIDDVQQLLKRDGVSQMMQKDRPMKSFLLVEEIGFDMDEDLNFWVQKCLDFNPKAKSSKKRKS
ncbi:MAG: TfoX/Sxy family transcriptional regulator of competence genes [Patiriisocius sp.]|jgi:TfoX/Sxy family transcriptional regulator of competence genes